MTDEEIEKALAICTNERGEFREHPCELCPYEKYSRNQQCGRRLKMNALDYINRIKAEKAQVRKDTAKEILDDLKETCPQGYLGIGLWARQEYIKYGVEVDDE